MMVILIMKLSAVLLATVATVASAFAPAPTGVKTTALNANAELEKLAKDLNPIVAYWDPLSLADADFWGQGEAATIGFLRHAEIKHGRVAMAAFVGYCVQSNFHFPWAQTLAGAEHPSIDLSPEAQWDAIPLGAKWQIFVLISALELWDECGGGVMPHYMSGRQPGKYPTFQSFRDEIHFVFDLYDPFGFFGKMTDEQKETRLKAEINNGRLAMLGIFGFLSADAVPGSVPLLKDIAIPYDGDIMIPFKEFSYFS
jgi:hypothetical protein